jgi:outer membrane protein assembly factor BamB
MVVLTGDEATLGGQGQMRMMAFTRDRSWGADVTQFRGEMHVDSPIAAEVQADPPKLTIVGPEDLETVNIGGLPLILQEGRLELPLEGMGELDAAVTEMNAVFDRYVAQAQEPGGDAAPEEMPPLREAEWSLQIPVPAGSEANPVWRMHPADLDGDGAEELIVLRANFAQALDASGETLWRFAANGKMLSVTDADLDGDGAPEVLVGSADEHIYVLDGATGEERRSHHADVPLRVGTSSVHQPQVGALAVEDVDADGTLDVIACLMNGNLMRYDLDFNALWRHDRIEHGPNEMVLRDLDDDGTLNIIVGNHYGRVEIFDENGKELPAVYSELGDVQMAIGDLNGDDIPEIANGSSTGAFTTRTWRTREGFEFPNYGFAFTQVLTGQMLADETPELLAASQTGYVYALDAAGEVLQRRYLGDAVNDMALIEGDAPMLAVACDDGFVYLLDAQFAPTAAVQVEGRPLLVGTMQAADGPRLLIGTQSGVSVVGRQ